MISIYVYTVRHNPHILGLYSVPTGYCLVKLNNNQCDQCGVEPDRPSFTLYLELGRVP